MRHNFARTSIIVLTLFLSLPRVLGGQDFISAFQLFIQTLVSIQASISSNQMQSLSGNICAMKGNRYSLEALSKTIVSDGNTVWMYNTASNQVIISELDENSSQLTIDQLFFSVLLKYNSVEIKEIASNRKRYKHILKLTPATKEDRINNITAVVLRFNGEDAKSLASITVHDDKGTMDFTIKNFKPNSRTVNAKLFDFSIPKNAQVVDVR